MANDTIPRSGLLQAPGHPLPPDALGQVREILTSELTATIADHGLRLETSADPGQHIMRGQDLTLAGLCDFAEAALKRAVRRLSADLIGGPNVTRLDGTLSLRHPRLPYRRALRIVGARGWRLALGDELTVESQASLVRFCGLLPVHVMFLPGQPQPTTCDTSRPGLSYILPWGGEVMRGALSAPGANQQTVCQIRLDRLVQFVLGLDGPASNAATA